MYCTVTWQRGAVDKESNDGQLLGIAKVQNVNMAGLVDNNYRVLLKFYKKFS